jgi:hypothetical protein
MTDKKNNSGGFPPKVTEKEDELLFQLRDDVYMSVTFATEKKLKFQLWRDTVMLPPTEGNIYTQAFRDQLVSQARAGFNKPDEKDQIPHIEEDIGMVATMLGSRAGDGTTMQERLQEREGPSVTEKLITLAEENAVLFHTPEKVAHAACTRNEHIEVYELNTREFRMWLRSEFRRTEREKLEAIAKEERDRALEVGGALAGELANKPINVPRPPAVPANSIEVAIKELEATAVLNGEEEEVYLRVAGHDGKIYVDLCNAAWEVVEISPEGWKVTNKDVPIKFVRSNIMKPMPRPKKDGSVEELKRLLTLGDGSEETKGAWSLVLAWLMQSLRPNGGQYPVLILLGGHGTAKSTTLEMLRELVDPAVVPHEHTYKDARELYIECVASWMVAMDNLSALPAWLSDTICRLATGGGFKTRTLFSNRDQEVFKAQRPVIVNGISDVASRADLLDRALLVDLPVLKETDRKYLKELWADFRQHQPHIMGALFDALSEGLRNVEGVDLSGRLPRMADFARWAVATETALGLKAESFMSAYSTSRVSATESALEAEPVWRVLYQLAQEHTEEDRWVGNMKQLLGELNDLESDDALRRSKHWPKTERGLQEVIKRLGPALLELGVQFSKVETGSRREGRRYEMFYKEPSEAGEEGDSGSFAGPGIGADSWHHTVGDEDTLDFEYSG